MLAVLAGMLWWAPAAARSIGAKPDSLCRLGQEALGQEDVDRAEGFFEEALEGNRKYAPAHCGLGYIYLKQGDFKRARDAFWKAQKYDRNSPEAYNGLGLVYASEKGQWVRAIYYFVRALGMKPDYVEAQYNIGMTHLELLNRDAIKAFERVVEMDPDHSDAYYRIGYLHEVDLLKPTQAATYYEKQLAVNPRHEEAMWRLGQIYRTQSRTDEAARTLVTLMRSEESSRRKVMLELAEVYLQSGEFGKAETLFETYLAGLPRVDREPYDDVSLLASPEEKGVYQRASDSEREAFLARFWKRRDPTPITEANERRVEHFRRVTYALEHYGRAVRPWDRRGEIYVRYGEPDHRSSSKVREMEADPRVRAVKQRLLDQADPVLEELLHDYAAVHPDSGGVMYKRAGEERARRQQARRAARLRLPQASQQEEDVHRWAEAGMASGGVLPFLGRPVFPITERTAWEYWIYADVAGGIEVVFMQVLGGPEGVFEYAALPGGVSARRRRFWDPLQPEDVMRRAVAVAGESYVPPFLERPLYFAAYPATFQGWGDSTRVEVYFGFPSSGLTPQPERKEVRLRRGAVLYDASGDPVYLAAEQRSYRVDGEAGIIPDVVSLGVQPGDYYLAVQAVEEATGRTQVYGMPLSVPAYGGDGLRLSDVELAASVAPASSPDAFVKHDLRVVPLATRFYSRTLHVFIYYEIYGLIRDEFGQTDYQVAYTIRPRLEQTFGARVLGGVGRLLGVESEKKKVTIAYDQAGDSRDVASYLAVDMSGSEPGEYLISVTVTDLHSGQNVSKTAEFRVE